MSGRWDDPDVPHRGWICVEVSDLEEATHTCEMCGQESIRYVHTMTHQDYHDDLRVGCVCADKMEAPYVPGRARERERSLRNRAARRKRWLRRPWRESADGRLRLNVPGVAFVLRPVRDGWRASVKRPGREWVFGQRVHQSLDALKLALFDYIYPPRFKPEKPG